MRACSATWVSVSHTTSDHTPCLDTTMSLVLTVTALHLFGKDAFFQPYLPLQQIEMLHAPSWLAGTTNQIVTQQKDCKYDVLVNVSRNRRSSHCVSDSPSLVVAHHEVNRRGCWCLVTLCFN